MLYCKTWVKSLAEKELANPSEAVAQAALGEGWASQANKEVGRYKAGAKARAAEWLEKAIPGLTGLVKVSAQKTLASLGPTSGAKGQLTLDLGGGVRMEFLYIKAGVFTMGSTQAPTEGWQRDERPPHKVELTRGFYLGKYEVTRGQFAAFVRGTGYKTDAEKVGKAHCWIDGGWREVEGASWQNPKPFAQTDDHPAVCISWNDAEAFCKWLAGRSRKGVRLPTEAEWEYACRAGTTARWSFGDEEAKFGDHGWCRNNSGMQTHPVGQKKPNPWGLFDMHGNVWEWVQDWHGPYGGDARDPEGPAGGSERCLRGGDWYDYPIDCRSAFRYAVPPTNRGTNSGVRVAVR
jgi:formylglycine-generating enzyme required for sulfatase activity